jgi:hypothetical protein
VSLEALFSEHIHTVSEERGFGPSLQIFDVFEALNRATHYRFLKAGINHDGFGEGAVDRCGIKDIASFVARSESA